MTTVGIPRALLYYQYYPMWKSFFELLGAETVVSPPTTRATLAQGSTRVVADTCLPAKLFIGHVVSLVDKCDCIFIPAIRSIKPRTYNCSKFLGLPDMTKAVVPEAPPLLEIDIDINRGKRVLYQAVYRLGRHFSLNPFKIRRAALTAWQTFLESREMARRRTDPLQAVEGFTGPLAPDTAGSRDLADDSPITIAVIGHAYMLYDEHVNYQLIRRLRDHGVSVVTPDMLPEDQSEAAVTRVAGRAYWTYEEDVVGAGGHYLESGVDGIIGVMAFGCGPDSLMMDLLHRYANRLQTSSFMCLTLEEHTSETGLVTRLEAFLDMIRRKRRRQVIACA